MLLKRGEQLPPTTLQVILDGGGVGDDIGRLVAVREALRLSNINIRLFCFPNRLPLIDACVDLLPYRQLGRLDIHTHSEMASLLRKDIWGIQFSKRHFTPGRISLVDDGLLTICDTLTTINNKPVDRSYITIDAGLAPMITPRGPLVAITLDSRVPVRELPVDTAKEVLAYLHSKNYETVLIGVPSQAELEATYDLRGKTTLLEAQAVLNTCTALIGVDNGVMHLAGTCKTPPQIVAGYTTVAPQYREINKNGIKYVAATVTPPDTEEDQFCQSKHNFLFDHDFRECLYGDYRLTSFMTGDRFIAACKEIGL